MGKSISDERTSIENLFDVWLEDEGIELTTEQEHAYRYGVIPVILNLIEKEKEKWVHEQGLLDE